MYLMESCLRVQAVCRRHVIHKPIVWPSSPRVSRSLVVRASDRCREGHGFESCLGLRFFVSRSWQDEHYRHYIFLKVIRNSGIWGSPPDFPKLSEDFPKMSEDFPKMSEDVRRFSELGLGLGLHLSVFPHVFGIELTRVRFTLCPVIVKVPTDP